jgi:hypothetical protein
MPEHVECLNENQSQNATADLLFEVPIVEHPAITTISTFEPKGDMNTFIVDSAAKESEIAPLINEAISKTNEEYKKI